MICDLFLLKKNLINHIFYNPILKFLIKIYKSKDSNKVINEKIIQIFNLVKNDEQLKVIIEEIYKNELILKEKIEILIK